MTNQTSFLSDPPEESVKPVNPETHRLTGKHYRAIGVYAKAHDLKLGMSVPPEILFTDANGVVVEVHLDRIVGFYEQELKERAKARAAEKRMLDKLNGVKR